MSGYLVVGIARDLPPSPMLPPRPVRRGPSPSAVKLAAVALRILGADNYQMRYIHADLEAAVALFMEEATGA